MAGTWCRATPMGAALSSLERRVAQISWLLWLDGSGASRASILASWGHRSGHRRVRGFSAGAPDRPSATAAAGKHTYAPPFGGCRVGTDFSRTEAFGASYVRSA